VFVKKLSHKEGVLYLGVTLKFFMPYLEVLHVM
jgi:hypothetical protein